ncbi:MAG: class I SAM-dependent methyltransferase [Terriglobia bacterium]
MSAPLYRDARAREFGGVATDGAGAERRVSLVEAYNRWAARYDAPNPLHALEERVLKPLLPAVSGKRVLDVACGTGRWLEKLLAWGAWPGSGVDLSQGMLGQASAKPALRGRVVRGDCVALPFPTSSADLVLCSLAAGHLRDIDTLARELARVAAPGSDVLLSDFHPLAHARGWRRTFHDGAEVIEVPSHAHTLTGVRKAFEQAGFRVVQFAEPRFGEPEREIFMRRGKPHLFSASCEGPALYVFRFSRVSAAGEEVE